MTTPRRDKSVPLRAGFMPLTDAAPLIVASRLGFAREEGLDLQLVRETSWATLRDRMAVKHLDIAHMLGPMAIADALGLTPLPIGLVVPMALGFGGNTVTVSTSLWRDLAEEGAPATGDPGETAAATARVIAARRWSGRPRLILAVVHPHSAHHYQLAYWLGSTGVDPLRDVEIVVLPPPLMTAALAGGQIDGFCAGEPWGSAAVAEGSGRIVTTSARIWKRSPEKVLGVGRGLANAEPEVLSSLVRAVHRAAVWCDAPENRRDLAGLLSEPMHIGQPSSVILAGLDRQPGAAGQEVDAGQSFLAFAAEHGDFPWKSHAAWFFAQMARAGQIGPALADAEKADAVYRPDLYRAALRESGVAMPDADTKIETDFFDGQSFDGGPSTG